MANKTVLLIHGDAAEAEAVARALNGCFRVDWVKHCSEGMERLVRDGKRKEQGISAVLVDLFLPDSQGIETFDQLSRVIRSPPQRSFTPSKTWVSGLRSMTSVPAIRA